MNIFIIIIILVVAVAILVGLIYKLNSSKIKKPGNQYEQSVDEIVNSIFDEDFRQELRNRGKLHFEAVLNDNALFLKQDLELTTSEIHEYLKNEITKNLQDEFKNYKDTIEYAKKLAVDSIQKTQDVLEEQRKALTSELSKQLEAEKKVLIDNFQDNMAEIINNYLIKAVGGHINFNDQLASIITDLETNKQTILEDINDGS
jgi:DNA-binding transcriptional MerR regulator